MQSVMFVLLILICAVLVGVPLVGLIYFYAASREPQHSIIRAHPYLGWMRYLLEKLGPEFRQYWFDGDLQGKPFSRYIFLAVVFASKYRTDLISFGGKRDFESAGLYLSNSLFPKLKEEIHVDDSLLPEGKKYHVTYEGLFTRREHLVKDKPKKWLLPESEAVVVGPDRKQPWAVRGMFGASATSYGAVGEHYIQSTGNGARMAEGSWINTGEGGVAPDHLATGVDVIAQIGPGLFGFHNEDGEFSDDAFLEKAAEPNIKAFELKFHQGAKIRGGHLPGSKVNEKIASIRKVTPGKTVDSPNRFAFLKNTEETLHFIDHLQHLGGKPVGVKIVVGDQTRLDEWFETMRQLDIYPDFITVDGSEGGSGATFQSMADGMGLPLFSALILVDDAARKAGVRDKIRVFASGKLITPDKVAMALAMGADLVNSARGFMMANGCIMALQCHTGRCPTGVTTTDPRYQEALVPSEKQWRVMNYILQMRESLFTLAGACGLNSPRELRREHVVYRNEFGRVVRISELFPYPDSEQKDVKRQRSRVASDQHMA